MEKIIKFLEEVSLVYVGTVENDQPRVRPFQYMLERDGKIYFCTANTKDVFAQLKANSKLELSAANSKYEWIRLNGEAVFVNDLGLKEAILNAAPLVKNIYKVADNPIFEVFYIDNLQATIADFTGNAPYTYKA